MLLGMLKTPVNFWFDKNMLFEVRWSTKDFGDLISLECLRGFIFLDRVILQLVTECGSEWVFVSFGRV